MPTLATVIPAYNAAGYIMEALDSVAAQVYLPDEILVVDDGSQDATTQIVSQWAAAHPELPLKLITQENGGAAAARNTAILLAKSDLVAFLDADDILEPCHHALLTNALEHYSDLAVVFGDQSVFTMSGESCTSFLAGKPIESLDFEAQPGGLRLVHGGVWEALIQGNFIPTSGSMTRRGLLTEIGLFDTELKTSEDRDLWLRMSRRGGLGYFPQRVARKREHANNLTSDSNSAIVRSSAVEAVLKQLRRSGELGLNQSELASTRQALESAISASLYGASKRGLSSYLCGRRHLASCAPEYLNMDIRGWLRAMASSLFGRPVN